MSPQQQKALIGAIGALTVIAVGVWTFWGAGWWSQREQDSVLSELTEVAEANAESSDETVDEAVDEIVDDAAAEVPVTAEPAAAEPAGDGSTTTSVDATTTTDGAVSEDSGATGTDTSDAETTSTTATSTTTTSTTTTTITTTTTATQTPAPQGPVVASFEIVETIPHDTNAFTQGFEISDGRLFESTGLVGQSSIRELDLETGEVLRNTAVPEVFGEGLTIVDDTAIQLTWQDGIAFRYDLDTFDVIDSYTYDGEGWGLCLSSEGSGDLIMSNGSSTLSFRDPDTFALLGTVDVRFEGNPIENLNELECVGDTVWANIWLSSLIVEIDPTTGTVLTVLDIDGLRPASTEGDSGAVWNGIAWDPADQTLLVTGKRWPTIYRLNLN